MKARLEALSPRALTIGAVAAVIVYAAVVWLLLVSPKRGEAADARAEVVAAEIRLAEARAASNRPTSAGAPVSDVFRLAKAMPGSDDQPGLVLELDRLARATGVKLRVIAPQDPLAGVGGPMSIPLSVTVGGSYFQISKFVQRIQALVTVRDGKVQARGRLFAVQSLELGESPTETFPELDATIVLNAYVYDGPIVPVETPEEPAEELEPSSGASAAGSTS
jgi:Tfp pilus assembly protein PilO